MHEPEVKPCPFCGHQGVTVQEGSTFRWRYAFCDGCGAQGGEVRCQTLGEGTPEEWEKTAEAAATAEWNERTAESSGNSGELEALRAERDALKVEGDELSAEISRLKEYTVSQAKTKGLKTVLIEFLPTPQMGVCVTYSHRSDKEEEAMANYIASLLRGVISEGFNQLQLRNSALSSQLLDAQALHLADESTIYQLEHRTVPKLEGRLAVSELFAKYCVHKGGEIQAKLNEMDAERDRYLVALVNTTPIARKLGTMGTGVAIVESEMVK